ncbi:hypothetical protein AVENLUH5627_00238 [Acinetobacter venetianus]|uniref:Uncharacterized protein n=1 Tax=Acinetobacter venetianus TaxID=52133 RepID=A0A150I378_9GAMM|nr:hypothetical protein [Acinetobacter venetianus]KXZ74031.1 hypothetical protein AVENLUH5627_00238 [Acinetobacter venetianus]
MENKQHYYTGIGVILFMAVLPSTGWSAQAMTEGSLALQTALLNNALPSIIQKAKQDALKPDEERWRSQRVLSDRNLREIRISMLEEGALSPYEEAKKTSVLDVREKKKATMKPHDVPPDRYVIYEFESPNIKRYNVTIK